jgi:hypothetical protein
MTSGKTGMTSGKTGITSGKTGMTSGKKTVIIFVNGRFRRVFVDVGFAGAYFDYPSCWQWMWTQWGWQRVFVCDWPWGY